MTKYLPQTAAVLATWLVVNALWFATLTPTLA